MVDTECPPNKIQCLSILDPAMLSIDLVELYDQQGYRPIAARFDAYSEGRVDSPRPDNTPSYAENYRVDPRG